MDVYLVIYNNGEPYEDNYECVTSVFSSIEKAEHYIHNEGYEKKSPREKYYYRKEKPLEPCKFGYLDYETCLEENDTAEYLSGEEIEKLEANGGPYWSCTYDCPLCLETDYSFMCVSVFELDKEDKARVV